MFNEFFVQQGWQCPICKRIYSPSTPMCYSCGGDRTTVNVTNNKEKEDIWEYLKIHPLKEDEYE